MNRTAKRIFAKILADLGCTCEHMIAADLGLKEATVARYTSAMLAEGTIERCWDRRALDVSDSEKQRLRGCFSRGPRTLK